MINVLQLYLLLPLAGSYVPDEVIGFISGLDLSLFSFEFMKLEDTKLFAYLRETNGYKQENDYLYLAGFKYQSTLLNLINVLSIYLVVPILHILLGFIKLFFTKLNKSNA